ncbi:MAG: cytochrome c-type biogenesis protein CcmH [Alphaproteobacteria bacterium]|nr:cytochrome c-type biogenesis protein CcmH [Alphaproteobacteria bacterium]
MRALAVLVLWAGLALGQGLPGAPERQLADPAQEERARAISRGLRCLVCQNQSIEDSNADLARDMRMIVRERVALGEKDDQVRGFLVARYGDWVLLDPPFKLGTLVLWLGPGLILIAALATVFALARRRARPPQPQALSAEERRRLKALIEERDRA